MATAGNKSINAKLKEIGREKRRKPDRTITSSDSDSDNDSNYTGGEKRLVSGEYSFILAMGAVFDPRMKFKLLKRCYDELNPFTSQEKIDHLESKLFKLFEEYRRKFPLTPIVSSRRSSSYVSEQGRDNLGVLDDLLELNDNPDVMEVGKSALVMYLEDPKFEMKNHPHLNVLQYWKENSHRFGALTYMAMDVLSIPITTVASESSFSIGSHIINKYRSRLLPSNVQALLCTRSWIYGYKVDGEDDNEEGEMVIIRSKQSEKHLGWS